MLTSGGRRGGVLAGLLLGLVGLFALLLAIAIGGGVYLANHVHVSKARGNTVVETPFGSMRVRENARFDPAHFGVPVYPGAVAAEDRKLASVEFDLGEDHRPFSVVAAHYSTGDPAGKVAAFYRERLPKWTVIEKSERRGRHGECRFEFTGNGVRRVVAIHEEGGVTHIGLASVGEPAAN